MKNIDKMKLSLINQITNMTVNQYKRLNDILCEEYDFNPDSVNKAVIFTCEDCRKLYGECIESERTEECDERFIRYMKNEVGDIDENNKI